MTGMKEILTPKSNLEGLKSRLPIGREPKIEVSDWSRGDEFENSRHRPFVQKSLSFDSLQHHLSIFGVIPDLSNDLILQSSDSFRNEIIML